MCSWVRVHDREIHHPLLLRRVPGHPSDPHELPPDIRPRMNRTCLQERRNGRHAPSCRPDVLEARVITVTHERETHLFTICAVVKRSSREITEPAESRLKGGSVDTCRHRRAFD